MNSSRRFGVLRRKAPQLIIVGLAIAVIVYLTFEILEDFFVEGIPLSSSPAIAFIISLTRNVKDTVASWGYYGIFGLMLLEASSLPIPSEVVLPFAGFLVSIGQLDVWIALAVSTIAGVLGALIDYFIGLRGVQSLIKHKILGRALLSTSQLETAGRWFIKYGAPVLFFSRLVPGFRTVISFPAGAVKMKLPKFIAYTTAGCLVWNSILIYVGWYLGQNWSEVAGVSHYLIIAVAIALIILVLAFFVRRNRRKARERMQNMRTSIV